MIRLHKKTRSLLVEKDGYRDEHQSIFEVFATSSARVFKEGHPGRMLQAGCIEWTVDGILIARYNPMPRGSLTLFNVGIVNDEVQKYGDGWVWDCYQQKKDHDHATGYRNIVFGIWDVGRSIVSIHHDGTEFSDTEID